MSCLLPPAAERLVQRELAGESVVLRDDLALLRIEEVLLRGNHVQIRVFASPISYRGEFVAALLALISVASSVTRCA